MADLLVLLRPVIIFGFKTPLILAISTFQHNTWKHACAVGQYYYLHLTFGETKLKRLVAGHIVSPYAGRFPQSPTNHLYFVHKYLITLLKTILTITHQQHRQICKELRFSKYWRAHWLLNQIGPPHPQSPEWPGRAKVEAELSWSGVR